MVGMAKDNGLASGSRGRSARAGLRLMALSRASPLLQRPCRLWEPGLPAMQAPRIYWRRAEAIAGKPAPTKAVQAVGAGLARDADAANALAARLVQQRPRKLWEPGLPAMQTPRNYWHRADTIAGKPAPTKAAQAVGTGLARDADAANLLAPCRPQQRPRKLWELGLPAMQAPRIYWRRASSNKGRASCRSRACPRCRRRERTGTVPRPSRASPLLQGPAQRCFLRAQKRATEVALFLNQSELSSAWPLPRAAGQPWWCHQ